MLRLIRATVFPKVLTMRCLCHCQRNAAAALHTLQHPQPTMSNYAVPRSFQFSKFPIPMYNSSSSRTSPTNSSCWKCNSSISAQDSTQFPIKCPKCSTLQKIIPGSNYNYFQILGLPSPKYKIDDGTLSANMKTLQKQLHPDLYGSSSAQEREISQYLSSIVNQGVKTLENPISRGLYILQLLGLDVDMEKQLTLDNEFLMEVMELNEKLESLKDASAWKKFRSKNNQVLQTLEQKLESAFEAENYEKAQLILSKMKYYENLQNKLKEVQGKFGVVD